MKRIVQAIAVLVVFALGGAAALVATTCHSQPDRGAAPSAFAAPPNPPLASSPTSPRSGNAATQTSTLRKTEDERNTIEVFRNSAPAAVFVTQRQVVVDWRRGRALEVPAGSGSGFVWDQQGHVVTNFHVIQNAKKLTVTLHDHRTLEATVVGAEPRKDIAVLKIEAPPDSLVPIARRDKAAVLEVGQKVVAIGNPFGLDQTLTTGIVSAVGREVDGIGGVTIRDMIQTDAAINPGNSGGPLLDSSGVLVGMNTMIYSKSGAWAGIGFAVPANVIQRMVPQIIRTGRAEQVGMGVNIDPQQRLERRFGVRGMIVLDVAPDSPAAKAGLLGLRQSPRGFQLGDVIVGIGDQKIEDYDDLYNTLDGHKPGDEVVIKLLREKKLVEVKLQLVAL